MDELIKQLLLLSESDRKNVFTILEKSLSFKGEGFSFNTMDLSNEDSEEINNRLNDIKKKNPV